eukprot:6205842-Pleurochrysis_carterae.AAC.1
MVKAALSDDLACPAREVELCAVGNGLERRPAFRQDETSGVLLRAGKSRTARMFALTARLCRKWNSTLQVQQTTSPTTAE